VIGTSVKKVVVAATGAMQWFQDVAKLAASDGLPVRWETPDGLMVLQAYTKPRLKRIELTFGGMASKWSVADGEQEGLDKRKQANSISPNWVHSMDASHMRLTVRECWELGIRSFSLVHDSYGTHAGNAEVLAYALRSEFVKMYSEDVMLKFKEDIELQLHPDTEIPPLPEKGDLDLSLVMDSLYFFA